MRPSPWLWLIILAVLLTRLAGVHLHYCLDGQEPQTTMHTVDGSIHNDAHHTDSEHTDQDIDLLDALLAKLSDRSFHLPLLLTLGVALVLLPPIHIRWIGWFGSASVPILYRSPSKLRPPLRGPPTMTYCSL